MEVVVLVIHLFIAIAMIGMILLQRSEGGALGIGGGGTAGGLFSARGAANALTKTTGYLAAAFFATSIILTIMANANQRPSSVITPPPAEGPAGPATPLPYEAPTPLEAPTTPAPAPATPPASGEPSTPVPGEPTQPATPPAGQPETPPATPPANP